MGDFLQSKSMCDVPQRGAPRRDKKNSNANVLNEMYGRFLSGVKNTELFFDVSDSLLKEYKYNEQNMIFKSQIILLVSVFEYFIHEIYIYGLLQFLENEGKWRDLSNVSEEDAKSRLPEKGPKVRFKLLHMLYENKNRQSIDKNDLFKYVSTNFSPTNPDSIEEELKIFGLDISDYRQNHEEEYNLLKDLVKKRNKIVHEWYPDNKQNNYLDKCKISEYVDSVREFGKFIKNKVEEMG